MKSKVKYVISASLFLLFTVLIVLLKTVDVKENAVGGEIGLSHINLAVHGFTGVNGLWDKLTDVIAAISILIAAFFTVLGLIQLIKRRSIKKVDREILYMGGLYIAVVTLYFLFEKVVINLRPTEAEASFPSSHTMVACVIFGAAILVFDKYIKNKALSLAAKIFCTALIITAVAGRLISGVHWLTDICGAVLISGALVALYSALPLPKDTDGPDVDEEDGEDEEDFSVQTEEKIKLDESTDKEDK